jgi:uroporphyrinogen-III synthase
MRTILYLGSDPSHFKGEGRVIHCPVIRIVPRSLSLPEIRQAFDDLSDYSHFIFTSKHAVRIFFEGLEQLGRDKKLLEGKHFSAIGAITASHLEQRGFKPDLVAEEETQEGVIAALRVQDLDEAYIFLPRSSLSRPVLVNFLLERGVRHQACDLYDTHPHHPDPLPDLQEVDEIVFTSPSTVNAFFSIYSHLPERVKLTPIGPVTKEALDKIS